jgi:hypothetical protein
VRSLALALLASVLVLTAACDPGMTILQDAPNAGTAANKSVVIHVRTIHPFISETWYAPGVEVQNASDSPVSVAKLELVTRRTTFQNKPRRSGAYPAEIPSGTAATLDVWFDLADPVKKTFQEPVELWVYYRNGNKERVAHTNLIGGPLHTADH